jgi:hypothetical protein
LNPLKYILACLLTGICGMGVLSGCAPTKGSCVLGKLPSPLLSFNRHRYQKPSTEVAEGLGKPVNSYVEPRPSFSSMGEAPAEWFPPVADHDWEVIVVHHSASDAGSAKIFDAAHRAKGWDELGYHFVIGNGSNTPDGYVEVGPRWFKQKHGAHCKTPSNYYNDYGIGICLVGDFDTSRPTAAQMESLHRLVAFLTQRYHISPNHIFGHGEVRGTSTHCPGRYFPMYELRYWCSYSTPIWASTTR